MTTAANVNALADLAGIPGRPFSFKGREPMVNGVAMQVELTSWVDLGTVAGEPAPAPSAPVMASKKAGIPTLLLPKLK